MDTPARPLLLPDGVVFTCQSSGACCRSDWLIGVDEASHARLRGVDWTAHDPALPKTGAFVPLPFPLPSGERVTFARRADGARLTTAAAPLRWRVRSHALVESRLGRAGGYVVLKRYG